MNSRSQGLYETLHVGHMPPDCSKKGQEKRKTLSRPAGRHKVTRVGYFKENVHLRLILTELVVEIQEDPPF